MTATALCIFVVLLMAGCSGSTKPGRPSPAGSPQPNPAKKVAAAPDPTACSTVVGLPADLAINPPAADASPDAAAFAGSWEGIWDWNGGKLPARLVVTSVQGNKVSLVYATGTAPGATPTYSRASGIEVADGKIEVGGPEMIFTFALDPGGRSLSAQLDVRNQILKTTLRSCNTVPANRP